MFKSFPVIGGRRGEEKVMASESSSYPKLAVRPVGKHIGNIYEDRLRQFFDDGQYRSAGLMSKLDEGTAKVKLSVWSAPELTRPTFKEATSKTFKPTKIGESFGPSWSTHWFKIHLTVPSELKNKKHLELHWDTGSEGLIWTDSGEPLQGLMGNGERTEWILPETFRDGKEHTFYIEMACNGMFGCGGNGDTIQPPDMHKYFTLSKAEIVAVNLQARALYYDFSIIGDAAREFPKDSWQQHEALQVCNQIMDTFIAGEGSNKAIDDCRKIAQTYVGDKVDSAKVYADGPDPLIYAVGHCHIDTCWLWPWAETKRKVARSWATQCDLMDRYPEHRFACSSAQQYKWLEMYYPSLFERVKAKVKDGKFNPIGGSWVEHDTNMPSGESLVRQFIYGQRFFESRFGQRSTTFWLPDTFGYSAQLPQLCRLAGMTRFFTQKLSWNNINTFPHTTFNWVAPDGSQVICHMPPSETYTAEAHFGDVKRSITQHKSMDQDPTSLLVFGKGDGGGGPTRDHLEKLRRCRGIADKVGLLPPLKMGDTVDDFYARLEKRISEGLELTTWYGELYFEFHRGTYTTQANNKRNNRAGERMMHDIEFLATYASIAKESYKYPKKQLDEMWENILICQFHDCLPGSSIEMCYDDSDELYEKTFKMGEKLFSDALDSLGFKPPEDDQNNVFAPNTLPFAHSQVLHSPDHVSGDSRKVVAKAQRGLADVDYLSKTKLPRASINEDKKNVFRLSNDRYTVELSSGVLTSFYDKLAEREIIPPGSKGHQLVVFDDKPLYWQAWDVEVYHLESRHDLHSNSVTFLVRGPDIVSVQIHTEISSKSWIKTTVSLGAEFPEVPSYLEFSSEVNWHEDKKFLKVEFPVDIINTEASYETQFGIVRRPTHYNTSWDMAKFEVCCHKWADLSEAGYGVSILNDSKYGFATQGNVMRLSLLRAPKAPDAHADMGRHHIRYAMMPHVGPLDARTVKAGIVFNNPLSEMRFLEEKEKKERLGIFPFMKMTSYLRSHPHPDRVRDLLGSIWMSENSNPAVIIDTIKRGEDDEDVSRGELPKRKGKSIIIRLYDCLGGKCKGKVLFGSLKVKKVVECNLLEDDGDEFKIEDDGFNITLRAFEVKTFRLTLE